MAKLMSAPNKQYDPVEVTALSPEQIAAALKEALAAIAKARTLDELKAAPLAHAEIGALPPQARAEAGQRVGAARREVRRALDARQAELEAERDQRVLV